MSRRSFPGIALFLLSVGLMAQASSLPQFLEAPEYTTGTGPQAVATASLRGTGMPLDLVVANYASNTVSVLLGNGDGTFAPKTDYATGVKPQGVALGDFNGDGKLDMAVTNASSNTVSVFLGNGDGTFRAKVDYATGNQPQGIAVGDFNGDGHLDIAVANAKDGNLGVLLGNGNGTFSAQVTSITGVNPWSLAVGDFNNDGILDVAVANNNNNNVVSIMLGKGNGTFQQFQTATGATPVWVAVADLNGDGNLDIAVADQQSNQVSILLGNGKGVFTHAEYNVAAFPTAVAIGDFNGDGILDVAVSAGNGNTVSVLWGVGDGTFVGQQNAGTGDTPFSVISGDFNNDGITDLVVANSGGSSVSVLISNGSADDFQSRTDYPAYFAPYSVAVANFGGKVGQDLVVANNCPCGEGYVSILQGNGDGTLGAPTHFLTGPNTSPYSVVAGDFNKDGKTDVAVALYGTGAVGIMLGDGQGNLGGVATYPVGSSVGNSEPASLATASFRSNGILDIVSANFHDNTISVLLGNGDGSFRTHVDYTVGTGPVSVAVGDFNKDGKPDLVVINETSNNASILLGNGDGTFQAQKEYPIVTGGNPLSVAVGDFNGDGNLDLAVADYLKEEVSVLMGNGDGSFQAATQFSTGANPSSVVIADFNGDGKLDLALTSTPLAPAPGNVVSLLLGNGDGTFRTPTQPNTLFGTGSYSYSGAVGVFDQGGAPELVVANGQSNTVSVLLNIQGTKIGFTNSPDSSVYGQSVTLTATVAAAVSQPNTPTGTVTFKNGSTVLGSGPISSGQVSINTSTLPTGTDTLSAVYSGDSNFQTHTVTAPQTVNQAGTSTALGSSVNPSGNGQLVTFTATVASSTTGTPTGTVTFMDGATSLGTSPLAAGVATLSTSALSKGTHSISSNYSGDTNFTASTASLSQIVGLAITNTMLSSSSNSPSLTLTAQVSSTTSGTITGTVTFLDGSAQLGTAPLNGSGAATLSSLTSLTAGPHNITASYGGDSNFAASSSSASPVSASFTLTDAALTPGSVQPGSSASSTITIAPTNGFNPSLVKFTCAVTGGGTPAPACSVGTITGSTASVTISTTPNTRAIAASFTDHRPGALLAFGLLIPALLLGAGSVSKQHRQKMLACCFAVLLIGGCIFQAACSSSSGSGSGNPPPSGGTPAGTYTITVTGASGSVTGVQAPPMTLTVQ